VLLCLDEAQAIPVESLEALRLLTNLETEKRKLLQIVLFGQPELNRKLELESIRQLAQRITFHYHLGPAEPRRPRFLLAHRLRVAGFVRRRAPVLARRGGAPVQGQRRRAAPGQRAGAQGADAVLRRGRAAVRTQPAEDVGTQQRGETLYRRGLAALQEGRVQEALASLEQAVLYYPRHDAARQTLIGLLIENRRTDEAMRHLQFGIGLDPRQVNMAMLLARLQLERGGAAVETLQRSLPYAGSNAEYRAFLAGALQHDHRNREAAEQYQAALRLQPQNGVWWMGLGISLQADKRNAEARDAFTRARATGVLNPELQVFVERKLQQLN
jgi:MSHA biogenesis protein MshN